MENSITWPLLVNVIRRHKLSNTYGFVRDGAALKPHQGWDLEAKVGSLAYAIATGTVAFTANGGAYGKQICIRFELNGKVLFAFYAHMQHILVSTGAEVSINDQVGTTGKSGNASNLPTAEQHLHFEIRMSPNPGFGLAGRLDPFELYGICPLHAPIAG